MSDQDDMLNAIADADTLGVFVNAPADRSNPGHPDGTVTSRGGSTYPVLAKLIELVPDEAEVTRTDAIDLATRGVDLTGAMAGQRTAIQAVVADALDDFSYTVGKTIVGVGKLRVDQTLNYYHAAIDAPNLLHFPDATLVGTEADKVAMIRLGKLGAPTAQENNSIGTGTQQILNGWGFNSRPATSGLWNTRASYINLGVKAFELTDETSTAGVHHLSAANFGCVAHVNGNFEKQRIRVDGMHCDLILKLSHNSRANRNITANTTIGSNIITVTAGSGLQAGTVLFGPGFNYVQINGQTGGTTGGAGTYTMASPATATGSGVPLGVNESYSTDSCRCEVSGTNSYRLFELVDEKQVDGDGRGADMSAEIHYICEAAAPSNPERPLIVDQNDKFIRHYGIIRGFKSMGGPMAGGVWNWMARNDGIDTTLNDITFTTAGGRAFHFEGGRNLMGRPVVRGGTNAGTWDATTGTVLDNKLTATQTFLIGQWISGGGLTPINVSGTASVGIQYGSDTRFSISASFGPAVSSMGTFAFGGASNDDNRPKVGARPYNRVAFRFHKALTCFFPIREAQGQIAIGAGLLDSTITVPAPWLQDGYDAQIEAGARFTLVVQGSASFDQLVGAPWLSKLSGLDQIVKLESCSDLDGCGVTYRNGQFYFEGQLRPSTVDLQAQASNLNRYFRRASLFVSPDRGARAAEAFIGKADGSWKSLEGGTAIVPGPMAATTAAIGRMGVAPSTAFAAIYDRFLYELTDMALIPSAGGGGVMGHMLGMDDAAASRLSIFPAGVSGDWYDLTSRGTPAFVRGRGHQMQPATLTVVSAPAAGTTLTLTGQVGSVAITFADAATALNPGAGTATVDRRTSLVQIATDIAAVINNRNGNTAGYVSVSALYFAGETRVTLAGSIADVTHTASAALTLNAWNALTSTYSMQGTTEGLGQNDHLMVVLAARATPGFSGSSNVYDLASANGRSKLRVRDNAAMGSAGSQTTVAFPSTSLLMPAPKMFGALAGAQFAIDGGRVVAQAAVSGAIAGDLFAYGASRELSIGLLLRASDLIENVSGTIRAKDNRLLRLHRACVAAYKSALALA